MISGTIVKGIGGFYYVKTANGVVECRACGKFRNEAKVPSVGDFVDIDVDMNGFGTVKNIKKRKNFFVRPPISNIDTLAIVAAAKKPNPDFMFIDKMLLIAQKNNVNAVLCLNKTDLCSDDEIKKISDIYKNSGCEFVKVSAVNGAGIERLEEITKKRITAFAGFSGVGKSSILKLLTGLDLQTGAVSKKLSRGKHTTRCVELLEYKDGTYLADTPGFSMLDVPEIPSAELREYFAEFAPYAENCRFSDCRHINERDCGIKNSVEEGKIALSRYQSYCAFYEVLKQKEIQYD